VGSLCSCTPGGFGTPSVHCLLLDLAKGKARSLNDGVLIRIMRENAMRNDDQGQVSGPEQFLNAMHRLAFLGFVIIVILSPTFNTLSVISGNVEDQTILLLQ